MIDWFFDHYFGPSWPFTDPRAIPSLYEDYTGLPPALIITAGHDPVARRGRGICRALAAAGVPVEYECYEGTIHGFMNMGRVLRSAHGCARKRLAAWLADAPARSGKLAAIFPSLNPAVIKAGCRLERGPPCGSSPSLRSSPCAERHCGAGRAGDRRQHDRWHARRPLLRAHPGRARGIPSHRHRLQHARAQRLSRRQSGTPSPRTR